MVGRDFFEVLVAGDNPEKLMKKYDKKLKTKEPYIVYKVKDAEFLKAKAIDVYNAILFSNDYTQAEKEYYKELRKDAMESDAEDFFFEVLTTEFDHDEEGNAISTENKNGKYSFYQDGKLFSIPFITKDGREVFQAKKGEINWKLMHMNNKEVYEIAWDMVMGGKEPKTEQEKLIYENMKNRTAYFKSFGTKENYVVQSTAFWAYAFVDEKGWKELEEGKSQFDWVNDFYDKFIKPMKDDTLLTIYECKK